MPEHVIRWTVFDPDRNLRSSTWRCFAAAGRGKDDVYVLVRELGHVFKFSLHESGEWRFAFTDEYVQSATERGRWKGGQRLVEGWDRPEDIGSGVTLAFRIVVPHSALTVPAPDLSRKITRVPPPEPGQAREMVVFLTASGTKVTGWPGRRGMNTELVGSFPLDGGETVWVVHHETEIPFGDRTFSGTEKKVEPSWETVGEDANLRALLMGHRGEDGSRFVMEARVRPLKKVESD